MHDRREPIGIVAARTSPVGDRYPPLRPDAVMLDRHGAREAAPLPLRHLLGGQAEDEDILGADMLADLDIGAVQRADGERAVERKLHVAGAGRFHAGGRNLLGQIGRRNDRLGER